MDGANVRLPNPQITARARSDRRLAERQMDQLFSRISAMNTNSQAGGIFDRRRPGFSMVSGEQHRVRARQRL
jgi:hypothetical protein